ncbi:MAG: RDD family protein [Gammaproteobacteria bacterium]|nr:RDD family protein [Gammaproteobacteria bacterium]
MFEVEYGGFWIRFAALFIDAIFICLVFIAPAIIIYGQDYLTSDILIHGFWDVMLSYVLPFVVTIWFWLKFLGTPGKLLLDLQIVDAGTLQKMTLKQAVGRYFAYIPAMLPLLIGLIWVAFDKRKQGWHDKLAGTVVVRGRSLAMLNRQD